jgi:hypothetical protein
MRDLGAIFDDEGRCRVRQAVQCSSGVRKQQFNLWQKSLISWHCLSTSWTAALLSVNRLTARAPPPT